MQTSRNLNVKKIDDVTLMKPKFRNNLEREWLHREETKQHFEYINSNKLFNLADTNAWAHKKTEGVAVYESFYKNHTLKVRMTREAAENQDDPTGHVVVDIHSTDEFGNETRMTMSAATFGISEIAIAVTCLALVVKVGLSSMAVEDAIADAGIVAGEAIGEDAVEITAAEALGPIGIAVAILAFIIMLSMYLGARNIVLNLRYENRSTKLLRLVGCNAYDIDTIETPVELKGLHTQDGFEIYDCISYQNTNESKYKGVGLSLVFECVGVGKVNICIRNDMYANPQFCIAASGQPPKEFYDNCNGGAKQLQIDYDWGQLVIKNYLDLNLFNNYKFAGIISFHDKG